MLLPAAAAAQTTGVDSPDGERATFLPRLTGKDTAPGRLIVKYEEDAGRNEQAEIRRQEDLEKKEELNLIDGELVEVKGQQSVQEAIDALEARRGVEYAEPDRIVYPFAYGDEPRFGELWGLHNTGQTILGNPGVPNVDINALEASAVTQGSEDVVVAVIDDGVDFSHPDLAARAWVNEDEVPNNNLDDDNNGYIDDVNGYDFSHDDNTVHDTLEDAHGTHVAGTIAASVNGQGVVGVAPNVKIMAVKFIGGPFSTISSAIKAIEYASKNGARISNNSWGYEGPPDPALKEAIEKSGMLFVAAAGNASLNNDADPRFSSYPASYDSPNILSVAALNNRGRLAEFSSFGPKTVDVSAPGVDVLSTIPSVPAESGATLSSVGASGKAVVAGFGIDEVSGEENRAEFMRRTFEALERNDEPVVLVDDDLSSVVPPNPEEGFPGLPDVTPVISRAIESATGTAPEIIEVGAGDGPDLSRLEGKTVVWATGWAFISVDPVRDPFGDNAKKTLTFVDQNTLTRFLNGGGKLVLTGMDALFFNERSTFTTQTLGLQVISDYPTVAFDGEKGTPFEGQSYTLNNAPFAIPFFHDIIRPADPDKSETLGSGSTPQGYAEYASGTSMASPHATGVAALAASEFPSLLNRPVALKRLVMATGKPAPFTKGKTVTEDMVNAKAAVTETAPITTPISPKGLIQDNTPMIRATVVDLQSALAADDIKLSVDNKPKGQFVYNARTGALAHQSTSLGSGVHRVKIVATDSQGRSTTKSWNFKIK